MAVYAFEWKQGPSDAPLAMTFTDDLVIQEQASSTWNAGYPLAVDLSGSTSTVVELKKADADDAFFFYAATDALNNSSAIDLTQPGTNKASLPYIARPGDIFSVSKGGSGGALVATTGDDVGKIWGWAASSSSTSKAILDSSETTNAQFIVIGMDDRDAAGTSGGRLLVMYAPWATVTAPQTA
jgi:hypothetical protein